MSQADKVQELKLLINSETPLIYVETWEEDRIEAMLQNIAAELDTPLFFWTVTDGLQRSGLPNFVYETNEPMQVLKHIGAMTVDALYLLKDFHRYLEQDTVMRKLRDICDVFRNQRRSVLISAPVDQVPVELRKDVVFLHLGMPDSITLRKLIHTTYSRVKKKGKLPNNLDEAGTDQLVSHLRGLSLLEAERLLARSMLRNSALDHRCLEEVLAAKKEIIRNQGILEFVEHAETLRDVAGLANLKRWLSKRKSALKPEAVKFGLDPPRGILITGVQGCGKSLCAKAVAGDWQLPLLKLDAGNLYDKYVGESERRLRTALEVAEQLAPAVLWIDEMEKAFQSSPGASSSDGGVSNRILGSFLSWLQERKSSVFVVATSNNTSSLPPELVRKGRFDEIFFVDLPTSAERRDIVKVHLSKKGRKPDDFDLDPLVEASQGFSGAEIEQAVKSALYTAFSGGQELTTSAILEELRATVPLSITRREEIDELRRWSRGRAVPANEPSPVAI